VWSRLSRSAGANMFNSAHHGQIAGAVRAQILRRAVAAATSFGALAETNSSVALSITM
jgi:hypothetical protein